MTSDQADRPKQPREALWQRIAVGALACIIWLMGAMPCVLAYAIGDLLALPWYVYWSLHDRHGRRSSGYWRVTNIVFRKGTPLGPNRPRHHLWRWSRHMAWIAIDFCRMQRITAENMHQYCDLSEFPPVAELYAEGKGMIIVSGHVGVWDFSSHVVGLLDLPVTSVFRPSPLPALNRLIDRLRTGAGQSFIDFKNVMWTLKRALAKGEAIGILVDVDGKRSAVVAPFLGTPARTIATPALMHLSSGAPIVIVAALRTGRMRYHLRILDVIKDGDSGDRERDLVVMTTRINTALGVAIKEAPEQWLWQSRLFRNRPAEEQADANGLPPLATSVAREPGQEAC